MVERCPRLQTCGQRAWSRQAAAFGRTLRRMSSRKFKQQEEGADSVAATMLAVCPCNTAYSTSLSRGSLLMQTFHIAYTLHIDTQYTRHASPDGTSA